MVLFSRSFVVSLLSCLVLLSVPGLSVAERYSVKEDSFGNLSAQEVEEPVEVNNYPESTVSEDSAVSKGGLAEENRLVSEEKEVSEKNSADEKNSATEKDDLLESNSSSEEVGGLEDNKKKKISIFEQKYLEAERAAKTEIIEKIKQGQESDLKYDATEVNPLNFVDGDELVEQGGRRNNDKAPYYITVDAEGRQTNTFYDPVLINDALSKQQATIEYTNATIFERSDDEEVKTFALPEGADPVAASILNFDGGMTLSYIDSFSKLCCNDLPNTEIPNIESGKPRFFELTYDDLPYRFSDGDSRYLVVRLPSDSDANIALRFRSFIRAQKKRGVAHGVFFPQIVTLNKEKQPVRIFSGPLLTYHQETWTTHGYLEGVFEIDGSEERGERYLMINTTREALKQSSTIDLREDSISIKHMPVGSFELQVLEK